MTVIEFISAFSFGAFTWCLSCALFPRKDRD
jgi:hypothetical protein